jgi:cytochrome c biogenesis protein CcdA/thiol-disulfide isomerase/thioredoxin
MKSQNYSYVPTKPGMISAIIICYKGTNNMILLIAFAFLAGFITILSPCILSIAPILLAAGTEQSRYKPLGIITGLIISFSFFTLSLTAIVQATGISPDIFRYIALCIIILFGLTMIIPAFENAFNLLTARIAHVGSTIQEHATLIKTEFISGLLLGVALGLLWTPCAGPILATITTIAATGGITLSTILITIAYSLGAALPMLLICFGGAKIMGSTTALAPYAHTIRQIFGVIIIASAVAIIFHADTIIQEHIAHVFPTITLEDNPLLHKELKMLYSEHPSQDHAPELVGISEWINSEPLTLAQLRGKVVLLDFWTYTCINCIRTLPHVTQWYNEYKNKGLEIIGIHTPEFAFEKSKSHVEEAIKRFKITYPIALDNDYKTWRAYDNHYWPAHYLIDQNGMIVKTHFGEGNYVEMENAIRALLSLPPLPASGESVAQRQITQETYLGFERGDRYSPHLAIQKNKPATYQHMDMLGDDQVGLSGLWTIASDCVQSQSDNNTLELNFVATHVYLVMQSDKPQLLTVLLDGKPVPHTYRTSDMDKEGKILVQAPRAYEVIDLKKDYGRHIVTLQCPKGINAYVFTFGGGNT